MKIQADKGLAQPNNRHVKVAKQNTEMQEMLNIVEQYNHVFEDQGVQEDLFEKVPENESITWFSPVFVQLKPSFINTEKEHLQPQMICASVDLRVPNSYIERSRITQPPIVEDFVHKFHDFTIWSKLDFRQGYHQLVLDPESRTIATFSTPWDTIGSKFIPQYASLRKPLKDLTLKETQFHWNEDEEEAFQKLKDSISSNDVIAFFNPKLPIMVRTEASYNEGLSARLFQKTEKGWQPVHFISRTLTETEKKYGQAEIDALCVKWAIERFSIYLLGAPRFTIITAHKPLLTLFNKATANHPA
eukprot:gene10029-18659_t